MEYVPGGDFRTLLNNSGVLKEEHARFYISEMFAAVNELHKLGYIHRDLKPEVRPTLVSEFLLDSTYPRTSSWMVLGTSSSPTLVLRPEPSTLNS
jgi:serine/threonine protein kinase